MVGAEEPQEKNSDVNGFKAEAFPKKILTVIKHYNECFAESQRCLHCNDCIAYALIVSETLELKLPRGQPYAVGHWHVWNFVKFLESTISREYLPCNRALSYKKVKDFAWSLLHLSIELRKHVRSCLICHAEFLEARYTDGLDVFKKLKAEEYE